MTPDEFKIWRKAHKLTQQEAGWALDLTKRTVQHMEAGTRPIERRTMLACRYLSEHPEVLAELVAAGPSPATQDTP